jgi:hypothetical protein
LESLKGIYNTEDKDMDERILLKYILRRKDTFGGCGLDVSGSGCGTLVGYCEHGIEPAGSKKGEVFLV